MTTRVKDPDRLTRLERAGEVTELALQRPDLRALDADRLRAELAGLCRPGHPPRIVLSLAGAGQLASACLGTLTEFADALSHAGGVLVLCEVPGETAKVLKRSGLARKLPLARSRDHARRLAAPPRKHVTRAA